MGLAQWEVDLHGKMISRRCTNTSYSPRHSIMGNGTHQKELGGQYALQSFLRNTWTRAQLKAPRRLRDLVKAMWGAFSFPIAPVICVFQQ